jgi:excisionase family DNA binding protein
MANEEDNTMLLISEVAARTGVSRNTIRKWAQTGKLATAERRAGKRGYEWYTTVSAVRAVVANPPRNRPHKIGG